MTDRHVGSMVVLDKPIRDDEAEPILNAIRQIRGVASVEPVVGGTAAQAIADPRHRPVEDAIPALAEAITDIPLDADGQIQVVCCGVMNFRRDSAGMAQNPV